MTAGLRRGACPGLSAPMATGDGLLARLTPIDRIVLDAIVGFCAAARRYGNGTIEVTARGSLQVRGLTEASAPEFAAAVATLGIPASDGVPVTADALGDCFNGLIDSAALAVELRAAIARAGLALGPKVSVTVDGGGGRLHLDALAADVRLRAVETAQGPALYVAVGGNGASATPLAMIRPGDAPDVVTRILAAIAAHGPAARATDILRNDGIGEFRSVAADASGPFALPPRPAAEPIGTHLLRDGSLALGVAPAFGHTHADRLITLAETAGAHGVQSIRPAPGRALLLIGAATENAPALAAAIGPLGFIVRADDPRRRVIACPGKPACAAGVIEARALAADIAARLSPRSGIVHISGCAKGCAHPAAATLTVVGCERGCGIVHDGTAQAAPSYYVAPDDVAAEIVRITQAASEPVHG